MDTDVLVIGAGTTGAAVARSCARRGLRVTCVERGPLEDAGARWVNGVALGAFDRAGVARPVGEELHCAGHAFHLIAGYDGPRVVLRSHDLAEVDMRKLVARLQRDAIEAGAIFHANVRATAMLEHNTIETSSGKLSARFIIDASGLRGAGLVEVPKLSREDLCAAAQRVLSIRSRRDAQAFFESNAGQLGDLFCFSAVAGGYSIVNVRASDDHVSILAGSLPARGHKSGAMLIDEFVAANDWVGDERFGGARAIPLRRPFDRLVHGPLALLGDSGCQVFTAHGSGIGPGLYAAHLLAETLAKQGSLEDWATLWMREVGGLHAAYDVFRRFSSTLEARDVASLIEHRLLPEPLAAATLEQRMPTLDPKTIGALALGASRLPGLGARLGLVVTRMQALLVLYRAYPREPSQRRAWGRAVAAIFSEAPDPC